MQNIKSVGAGSILALAAIAIATSVAVAMPVTVPSFLNPGDQYRLAFVTSTQRDAQSSDIGASSFNGPLGRDSAAVVGRDQFTNSNWIATANGATILDHPFYALSGILTAPAAIPEPGTLGLAVFGLAGFAVIRRRRATRHRNSPGGL